MTNVLDKLTQVKRKSNECRLIKAITYNNLETVISLHKEGYDFNVLF